ncbi:hypothetical protein XENOCAPTIV_006391 [Xenoophorus captivus]|uniref:LHFPL tetraspan subfamily member 4b n=1 Tax=Xenoophorus captivus TaxID=1517983 RepID=A0ABV0QQB1_9TELE
MPLFLFVSLCPAWGQVCMESDWPVPDCRGGLSSLSPLPSFQSVAVLVGVSLWAVWTSVLCLCLFRFCSAATVYKICAWLQLTAGQSQLPLVASWRGNWSQLSKRQHFYNVISGPMFFMALTRLLGSKTLNMAPISCCGIIEQRTCRGHCVFSCLFSYAGFCLALACLLFPDSWESPEMRVLCGDSVGSFSPGNCSVHWAYILAMLGILDYAILATLAFVLANRQDALLPPNAPDGE